MNGRAIFVSHQTSKKNMGKRNLKKKILPLALKSWKIDQNDRHNVPFQKFKKKKYISLPVFEKTGKIGNIGKNKNIVQNPCLTYEERKLKAFFRPARNFFFSVMTPHFFDFIP